MTAVRFPPPDDEFASAGLGTLGLPDSPVILAAICTIASLLRPLDTQSPFDDRDTCIQRYRASSMAVLEGQPIELARLWFMVALGIPVDPSAFDAASQVPRTDWLGRAKHLLELEGQETDPDARPMATRYGWNPQLRRRIDPSKT